MSSFLLQTLPEFEVSEETMDDDSLKWQWEELYIPILFEMIPGVCTLHLTQITIDYFSILATTVYSSAFLPLLCQYVKEHDKV